MSSYWCPICHNEIPVKSPLPQAKGLTRSNHLRSHGINTSRLTVEQKKSSTYVLQLWKVQQQINAMRARTASLIYTTPKLKEPLRCGLCNVEVIGSFEDHIKTEQHQNKMPKIRPVKPPKLPVKVISDAERKLNRDKIAQAENYGYYSVANGRSYYRLRCECGEFVDVFAWRGEKRCPNCHKILHTIFSFKKEASI